MAALVKRKLGNPANLTVGRLYIYSLVPQKVNRLGVGLSYTSYNATSNFSHNLRWEQYPGSNPYEISTCEPSSFNTSELALTHISVLWELSIQDQTFQVLRNNEIANSFPAINCGLSKPSGITGNITTMEITKFSSYVNSNTPLFYRYEANTDAGRSLV